MSDHLIVIAKVGAGLRIYRLNSGTLNETHNLASMTGDVKSFVPSRSGTLLIESDDFEAETVIKWSDLAKAAGTTVKALRAALRDDPE